MDFTANNLKTNRSVPPFTIIPVLTYENVAQVIEWLCQAFGFTERLRIGSHRAQLLVGDGAVILSQGRTGTSESSDVVSHSLLMRVEDIDSHYQRALQYGARILQPPTDYPYGERQYNAIDLGGHHWTFSQSIADVDPQKWGATVSRPEKLVPDMER